MSAIFNRALLALRNSLTEYLYLIIAAGLVLSYTIIYGPLSNLGIGANDWINTFRDGARGNVSGVVTPYWALFLSYLPSRFQDPWGYGLWIGAGTILVILAAKIFKAPVLPVLLSYQFNWCLYYGQIDFYVVFGLALGFWANRASKPFITGIAILLLLIKPQIGLLAALLFFWYSPSRLKTALVLLLVFLLSLATWPGWPMHLIFEQWPLFLNQPWNSWTNTSLQLPLWSGIILSLLMLGLPMEPERKLITLVAANLLIFPYSSIYSQLSLLVFQLPIPFYLFAFIPWLVALRLGAYSNWGWAALFPLLVMIYYLFQPLLSKTLKYRGLIKL
jgi:hypothetical protein